MKGANGTYWGDIKEGIVSSMIGMGLTFRHFVAAFKKGRRKPLGTSDQNYFTQGGSIMTLTYPNESMPVPDNGRYRLHNEIDDCIVCDKCAKICPVNCIDIEPIKSVTEIGKTSDGSSKRLYAAKFDIDMAKCCYCGLCTTVCPTECLTMTKAYDYSEFDIRNMNYEFSDLTPQQADEKRKEYEEHLAEKQKAQPKKEESVEPAKKPVMKPKMNIGKPKISMKGIKPIIKKKDDSDKKEE